MHARVVGVCAHAYVYVCVCVRQEVSGGDSRDILCTCLHAFIDNIKGRHGARPV